MPAAHGNLQGLRPGQIAALERIYRRRFPKDAIYTPEQARELALLSRSINRQIALLIDRSGKTQMVIVGTATSIYIPELPPLPPGRPRSWRLLHTHLGEEQLTREDLLDMLFLRLDCAVSLTVNEAGEPLQWQGAWLLPGEPPDSLLAIAGKKNDISCYISRARIWHDCQCDHVAIAADLDRRADGEGIRTQAENRAVLVSVSTESQAVQEARLDELRELALSAGLEPAARLVQRLRQTDPRLIIGKGKLAELEALALGENAETLIFDGELTPAQLHNLADLTERKVLDRTQLILDIFAQRASTRAGKLQVELAQLAYALPRLAGGRKALDRLAGGIGGRGPGETRLETDRRKNRARMATLRKELDGLKRQRAVARRRREKRKIPVAALIGYTNVGKSSLLNMLTHSETTAENRLFATLDPVTRRIRFPREREITLADTVGFIRNLPKELMDAFAATLEELGQADLLIHVTDASHPDLERQIAAVEGILEQLGLHGKQRLLLLNKADRLDAEARLALAERWENGILISAASGEGMDRFLHRLEQALFMERASMEAIDGRPD